MDQGGSSGAVQRISVFALFTFMVKKKPVKKCKTVLSDPKWGQKEKLCNCVVTKGATP